MAFSNTIRPSLCRFTFLFIGLGISVFIWGLQYKVSLYFPAHSVYHQIPQAKLLSRDEQSVGPRSFLIRSAKALGVIGHGQLCTLTLFAWILALPATAGAKQIEEELERPWLIALDASSSALFFRPPPCSPAFESR